VRPGLLLCVKETGYNMKISHSGRTQANTKIFMATEVICSPSKLLPEYRNASSDNSGLDAGVT
jgi:hypothetical protein